MVSVLLSGKQKQTRKLVKKKQGRLRLVIVSILVLTMLMLVDQHNRGYISRTSTSTTFSPSESQEPSIPLVTKEGTHPALRPLPECTENELNIVRQQLPPDNCNGGRSPFCSLYMATKCPDATWLQEYFFPSDSSSPPSRDGAARIGIYLGCNKGMDAVNTLRMLSSDKSFDKELWRATLDPQRKMGGGACGQATSSISAGLFFSNATQNYLDDLARREEASMRSASPPRSQNAAQVYCVEAMPDMAKALASTASQLKWSESFRVTNAAMSDSNGEAYFPNAANQLGVEFMGLSDCQKNPEKSDCQKVNQIMLDTFVEKHVDGGGDDTSPPIIDILSIDVEGYDYEVLVGGANRTLKRVRYLEFEINKGGRWPEHSLQVAIDMLSDAGFACYWAGTAGHLWRITGCFLDHFEEKYWSNVACANRRLDRDNDSSSSLAARMERTFQETLAAGSNIRYDNMQMDGTDGIQSCGPDCRKEFRRRRNEFKKRTN